LSSFIKRLCIALQYLFSYGCCQQITPNIASVDMVVHQKNVSDEILDGESTTYPLSKLGWITPLHDRVNNMLVVAVIGLYLRSLRRHTGEV
jgi:hypothetical protein